MTPTNWDTEHCQENGHVITEQVCPSSRDGDTHHLVPTRVSGRRAALGEPVAAMTCIFCRKTERELREEGS